MRRLRIDVFGGYHGDRKPDPDHCYKWVQHDYENVEQYKARLLQYVIDLIDELDEGEPDDEDNADN